MEEIWKDVKGYEGLYQVSTYGRIKSLERHVQCGKAYKTIKESMLTTHQKKNGYISVHLYKDNKCKNFYVHILVAIAFIPNLSNKPCIDHINGCRYDNRVDNLRWCTHKENSNFPIARKNNSDAQKKLRTNIEWCRRNIEAIQKAMKRNDVREKLSKGVKKCWERSDYVQKQKMNQAHKSVCQYDINGNFMTEYISIREAARQTNISRQCISNCCNGKLRTSGGFKWRFKEANQ